MIFLDKRGSESKEDIHLHKNAHLSVYHSINKDVLLCVCLCTRYFIRLYLPKHLSLQVPEHIQRQCIIAIRLFALA